MHFRATALPAFASLLLALLVAAPAWAQGGEAGPAPPPEPEDLGRPPPPIERATPAELIRILEQKPGGKERLSQAREDDWVPLYLWFSPSRGDNFTTSDPRWAGNAGDVRPPDYQFVRVEGYVFSPDAPAPPRTVPLQSWYNERLEDNAVTSDPQFRERASQNDRGYPSGPCST